MVAATKQSLRTHALQLHAPTPVSELVRLLGPHLGLSGCGLLATSHMC